jgi:hypothetical protein
MARSKIYSYAVDEWRRSDDPLGEVNVPQQRREATLLRLHGWKVWWEQNPMTELWELRAEPPKGIDERITAIKFGSTWGPHHYGVLHRSTYPGVQWQLSRFDEHGPWGHGEHETVAEAVEDGRDHYGFFIEEILERNPHLPPWLEKQPKLVKGQADTYISQDGRVEIVNTRRVVLRDAEGKRRRVRMWQVTVDRIDQGEYESIQDAFEAVLASGYDAPSEGKKRKRAKMKPRKKRPVAEPVKEPSRGRVARPVQPSRPASPPTRAEAVAALTGLGFKRAEAIASVDAVLKDRPQAPLETVVRRSMMEAAATRSTRQAAPAPTRAAPKPPAKRRQPTMAPAAPARAKRPRPTRHARREAAQAAGVAVCPSAVYELFGNIAPIFSTQKENSPYWIERYDLVQQMFPLADRDEVDEYGDVTPAMAVDWWTTDLLTEPQRRRLHRAIIGRRFGSVVRALRNAKRLADQYLKSKPGTKKRDELQRKLETAEARYTQEIDGMVALFEADTEDPMLERAGLDEGRGEQPEIVPGEAWSIVDFCARELVYGTAERRAIAASDIAAMRQGALFGATPAQERPVQARRPAVAKARRSAGPVYYASGTNMVDEALGMLEAGHQIGVAIHKVSKPQLDKFLKLADEQPGAMLFVDSGAFSEVSTKKDDQDKAKRKGKLRPLPGSGQSGDVEPGVLKVVSPITDAEWRKRLERMLELAKAYGDRALIVLPDHVGSQEATLERLRKYRRQITKIRDTGAKVMVVLQGGPMSAIDFDRAASTEIGTSDYVIGWPMQKAWTPLEDIVGFARMREDRTVGMSAPKRMHLLGVGPKSRKKKQKPGAKQIREQLFDAFPDTEWSWDSCLICSGVQRGRDYIRPFTQAQDIVQTDIEAEALTSTDHIDYTDVAGTPSMWLFELWGAQPLAKARAALQRGKRTKKKEAELEKRLDFFLERSLQTAKLARVKDEDLDAFRADPNAWYHHREPDDPEGPERWERDPYAESAMEQEFVTWLRGETTGARKRRGAALAFGPHWPLTEEELPWAYRKDPRYSRRPVETKQPLSPKANLQHEWWDKRAGKGGIVRGPAGEVYRVHVGPDVVDHGAASGRGPSYGRVYRADGFKFEIVADTPIYADWKGGAPWRIKITPPPWHGSGSRWVGEKAREQFEKPYGTWGSALAALRKLTIQPWRALPGGMLDTALQLAQEERPEASDMEQLGLAEVIVDETRPPADASGASLGRGDKADAEDQYAKMVAAENLMSRAYSPARTDRERHDLEDELIAFLTSRDEELRDVFDGAYAVAQLMFAEWKLGKRGDPEELPSTKTQRAKKSAKKAAKKKAPPRVAKPKVKVPALKWSLNEWGEKGMPSYGKSYEARTPFAVYGISVEPGGGMRKASYKVSFEDLINRDFDPWLGMESHDTLRSAKTQATRHWKGWYTENQAQLPASNPRARAAHRKARLADPEAGRKGMTTAQLLRKMGL